jgi:uncharacterized membrane protein HdeD (DUF308 family)
MTNTAAIARHSHWGLVLLNGLLLVLSGLFLAAFPFIGAFTFTAAFGMYLVALGAVGLFAALRAAAGGHGSVLAFVGPPLAMLVGVIFWLAPEAGLVAVMEFAGAFTLVAGVFQIAAALGMAGRMHWGLMLLNGLLTLGAGICMLAQPGIAVLVFAIFFGVQLLFHGGHMIRVASRMKRLMP